MLFPSHLALAQFLPALLHAALFGALFVGLCLWLLGRRLARITCAILGLLAGLGVGLGAAGAMKHGGLALVIIILCPVGGTVAAWLLYRIWMSLSLATALALAGPIALLAWHGTLGTLLPGTHAAPPAQGTADAAPPSARESPVAIAPHVQGIADHARELMAMSGQQPEAHGAAAAPPISGYENDDDDDGAAPPQAVPVAVHSVTALPPAPRSTSAVRELDVDQLVRQLSIQVARVRQIAPAYAAALQDTAPSRAAGVNPGLPGDAPNAIQPYGRPLGDQLLAAAPLQDNEWFHNRGVQRAIDSMRAARGWYNQLSPFEQHMGMLLGGGGAVLGLVTGLLFPALAASLISCMLGSTIMVLAGSRLLGGALPAALAKAPGPRTALLAIGLITVVGVVVQWGMSNRRADK